MPTCLRLLLAASLCTLAAAAQARPSPALVEASNPLARAEYACARANCVPSKAPSKS